MTTKVKSKEEVAEFYDEDTRKKYKIKNNLRHYLIIRWLLHYGLKHDSKVLEIGCANGRVTSLIAPRVKNGKVVAVDISSISVEAAKANLKQYKNIEYIVSDMTDFSTREKFDIVLLADVLEHIPIDFHPSLFKMIHDVLEEHGVVFIHIPEPKCLEWLTKTSPEKLQIIDQPVHSNLLINAAYANGLYLNQLKSYSIFKEKPDYQYIVLTKKKATYHYTNVPIWKIVLKKLYTRLRIF